MFLMCLRVKVRFEDFLDLLGDICLVNSLAIEGIKHLRVTLLSPLQRLFEINTDAINWGLDIFFIYDVVKGSSHSISSLLISKIIVFLRGHADYLN